MDKICYRNPSKLEVIGHCGGDETNEWQRTTDTSRTLKKNKKQPWQTSACEPTIIPAFFSSQELAQAAPGS